MSGECDEIVGVKMQQQNPNQILFLSVDKIIMQSLNNNFQVKPLLEVTNNEEKMSQKEQELKAVTDKFEKVKLERDDLERQYQQMAEEKSMLAQQFRAEAELCAETEEVNTVRLISRRCYL
jgi:Myosin tail